ncbi:MAG: methylenetetrahydrofolate reductase [NAD(P)H] [Candidatus Latescibacteria bacterium]|nr:methylenetetrahydrofolate reductase [NAD(P)H] [Candidatus Latescibacterota bacterium]
MRFPEYFTDDKPIISFELYPPKTDGGMRALKQRIVPNLLKLNPNYITVTYGAGGSTRAKTLEIASLIQNDFGLTSACHLTCVGSSRTDIDGILNEIRTANIRNVVALRGDPPQGEDTFVAPKDGFAHGNELVTHIRSTEPADDPFGVAVAGYPEKHHEAPDLDTDIANLKRKVECGGNIIITQLFYKNDHFFRFVDKVRASNINVPIIPGLMPILSARQIQRITSMCGSEIPGNLQTQLNDAIDDDDKAMQIGIDQCAAQATELLEQGMPGIHFYVLNKSTHMRKIVQALPL